MDTVEYRYGHLRSVKTGTAVDHDGCPLPWFTYPAIEYLEQLDLRDRSVFEYGAGNNSLFFGERARAVTSVESDASWAAEVERRKTANMTLLLRESEARYVDAITEQPERRYDLIIVDGLHRKACAAVAVASLSDRGFVILDNADWFPETARLLRESGLIQVDFAGLTPNNLYTSVTSLFLSRNVDLRTRSGQQPDHPIGGVIQVNEPE